MDPTLMTGLALLQTAMAGKVPPPSIAETVPMKPVAVGDIRIVVRADGRHLNPLGGRSWWLCRYGIGLGNRLCGAQYAGGGAPAVMGAIERAVERG
ncbi:hypothetical protein [Serratia marcescens]|uniref:hypothetical protein n=1 Tax=Serratia marcescens TaxID=615 RepID=UPI000AEBF5E7|nr:hypothetical protein [Serratia marcescens]